MRMFEKQSKRVYSPRCMFIGRKRIYAAIVCCAASLFSSATAGTNGLEQIFSRQFGGSDGDFPTVLTVDVNGCTYIAGYTYSTNFPATPGRNGPDSDLFVTKLSATGQLIYSRVLGGSGYEVPAAIAADHLGNVYVTGQTTSTNFPLVNAIRSIGSTNGTIFMFKLEPTGSTLVYSTYLGGSSYEYSTALTLTPDGEAIIVGNTTSTDFATTPGAFQSRSNSPSADGFVIKLGSSGTNAVFSTLLGGTVWESLTTVVVDSLENVYVCGYTASADFPITTNAFQKELTPSDYPQDVFITKVAPDGRSVIYSSFWGGPDAEIPYGLAVDASGAVYVCGTQGSSYASRPIGAGGEPLPPVVEPIAAAAFLLRVAPSGSDVDYVRRFGTTAYDVASTLYLDPSGALHLAGYLGEFVFVGAINNPSANPGESFSSFVSFPPCGPGGGGSLALAPSGKLHVAAAFSIANSGRALDRTTARAYEVAAAAYSAPSVAIYSPIVDLSLIDWYGGAFGTNETVHLRLDAGDVLNSPVALTVLSGTSTIATFTNAPRLISLTNLAPGSYVLTGVATNAAGLCATSCPLTVTVVAAPPNDSFYRSTRITGTSYVAQASTAGASLESAEPPSDPFYPNNQRSVWWCWTAPANGPVKFRVPEALHPIDLVVYTGFELSQLERVVGVGSVGTANVAFNAVAGTTYHITVNSFDPQDFTLELLPAHPPANDDNANRISLSGTDFIVDATNVDATPEPFLDDRGYPSSVWWQWTAPDSGAFVISVASQEFFFPLTVWSVTNPGPDPQSYGQEQLIRAQAGEEFAIRVAGAAMGAFTLSIFHRPPPANDDFAAAAPITGLPASANGSTIAATSEPFEPSHGDVGPQSSVWYRWTAPSNGTVTLDCEPAYQSVVAVYSGSELSNLVQIASQSGAGSLTFTTEAGASYYIAVDEYYYGSSDFTLRLRASHAPTNDDFTNAISLSGALLSVAGSNVEATREPGEPAHATAFSAADSVWWRWTAPSNGEYVITLNSSYVSLLAAAYTGTALSNLVLVTAPVASPATDFQTRFSAMAGIQYYIAVAGYAGSGSQFRLDLRPASPPPNDDFADRFVLSGTAASATGSNIDAGSEPGEILDPNQTGATVWWTWTAPEARRMVAWLTNTSAFLGIRIFTGADLSSLSLVASTYSGQQGLSFHAAAAQPYFIAVDGNYGSHGTFTLHLAPAISPPNDHFTNAFSLMGISASVSAAGIGATREPGEPIHAFSDAGSLWWNWTAPASGRITIALSGGGSAVVYTGDAVNALTPVPRIGFPYYDRIVFTARAGTTYRIAVESPYVSPTILTLTAPAPPPNPRLGSVRQVVGGAVEFSFEVIPGRTNVIEASSDLLNWGPIATNVLDCGILTITDADAALYNQRFYRVRTD